MVSGDLHGFPRRKELPLGVAAPAGDCTGQRIKACLGFGVSSEACEKGLRRRFVNGQLIRGIYAPLALPFRSDVQRGSAVVALKPAVKCLPEKRFQNAEVHKLLLCRPRDMWRSGMWGTAQCLLVGTRQGLCLAVGPRAAILGGSTKRVFGHDLHSLDSSNSGQSKSLGRPGAQPLQGG